MIKRNNITAEGGNADVYAMHKPLASLRGVWMLGAALHLMVGTITPADISITDTHDDRDTCVHIHAPCVYSWDPSELLPI